MASLLRVGHRRRQPELGPCNTYDAKQTPEDGCNHRHRRCRRYLPQDTTDRAPWSRGGGTISRSWRAERPVIGSGPGLRQRIVMMPRSPRNLGHLSQCQRSENAASSGASATRRWSDSPWAPATSGRQSDLARCSSTVCARQYTSNQVVAAVHGGGGRLQKARRHLRARFRERPATATRPPRPQVRTDAAGPSRASFRLLRCNVNNTFALRLRGVEQNGNVRPGTRRNLRCQLAQLDPSDQTCDRTGQTTVTETWGSDRQLSTRITFPHAPGEIRDERQGLAG